MSTCNINALLSNAGCFTCTPPGMFQILKVALLNSIFTSLGGSDTVATLISRSACFACLTDGVAQVLRVQLLCEINSALAGAGPSPPTPPVNDPVFNSLTHYWNMDESSGTRVDTKGSVNLTVNGADGSGTGIDSNAYNSTAVGAFLKESTFGFTSLPASFSVWFKMPSADNAQIVTGDNEEDPEFHISGTDLSIDTVAEGAFDTKTVSVNAWHFAVIIIKPNGGGADYYWSVDGGAIAGPFLAASPPTGSAIRVGGRQGAVNILIDELATYNVALTQANCVTLWNGGAGKFYRP